MDSVYSVLNTIGGHGRYCRALGNLRATAPVEEQADRQVVGGNMNRGGFYHGACTVPTDPELCRARLSLRATRDTKTEAADGSYSWTSLVVADYDGGKWRRINDRFEARLTRNEYDALLEVGCVPANADLSGNVLVDVGSLPLFPAYPITPMLAGYVPSKRSLLLAEARLAKLKYLKGQARDYFFKNGISFDGLEPKRAKGASNPALVAVSVPYDKVTYVLEGESFGAVVDDSALRVKVGRSYQYNQTGYLALLVELDMTQAVVDGLRPTVRLTEMSMLERYGDTLTLTADGVTVTIKRVVETASQTFYGVDPVNAERYVRHNPTATIKGAAVAAPAVTVPAAVAPATV